jgi:carbonic anhydrase/acetyltransferase-like protein (isoleucine patch superfamily)
MLRAFQGIMPKVEPSVFIEETAVVLGDVVIGAESSVWFLTIIRGDVNVIRIGARTNIQDLCVLHVTHDTHPLIIGDEVTVGHRVLLHGCTVNNRVLVGMGAILMDGVVIGEDCVIGAGTLITEGTVVPPGSVVLGSPGRVKRSITAEERAWLKQSAANYVRYAAEHLLSQTAPGSNRKT